MLRSYCVVNGPKKKMIYTFWAATIRTTNVMRVFGMQADGRENIDFTEIDDRNCVRQKRRKEGLRLVEVI